MSLSPRGEASIRRPSTYGKALMNLPENAIEMATAENVLALPFVTALLNKVPPIPVSELTYTDMHGSPETIAALSTFLSSHFKVSIPKHSITVTSGVTSALDTLAHAFAEEGECALTPSPCYGGLRLRLLTRAGVRLITAPTDDSFPPVLTVEAMNSAWEEAGGAQSRIKFLLLVNPDNPTGIIHPPKLVLQLVQWAREHDLHVVVDEVYALSAHDTTFRSVLSYLEPCDDVHVVWGVSKDFSLPGIRIGTIITNNDQLQQALYSNLSYFSSSSRLAQYAVRSILPHLDGVVAENRSRLKEVYEFCRGRLEGMGVQVTHAEAGFFVWAYFGKWVCDEREEESLLNRFCEKGVILIPGAQCYAETPGCFRICYASVERGMLEDGLERIEGVLREVEEERGGG